MKHLLTSSSLLKSVFNRATSSTPGNQETRNEPQDGGCWAYLVLITCFLVNGIIFGIINTFGILFVQLREDMEKAGVEDAASKCGKKRKVDLLLIFSFQP